MNIFRSAEYDAIMPKFALILALLLSLTQYARADDPLTGAKGVSPSAIKVGDKPALDALVDKEATVVGTVASAAWNPSGKVFVIKFKDADATEFSAAIFAKNKDAMESTFKGDLAAAFTGAEMQITGKLAMYRDKPQIIINNAKQIVLVGKGGSSAGGTPANGPSRVAGVYSKLTLTEEQKQKISAIQKDADEKIESMLTDDQKKQLATLKSKP
jgi:DNA/RNA endonuclease YhcR with UshA esterase domain